MKPQRQHQSNKGIQFPYPITHWIAVCLYLGVIGIFTGYTRTGFYRLSIPWLSFLAIVLGVLILLILDYLEYRHQVKETEISRTNLAILMFWRAIVIIGASYVDGLGLVLSSIFIPLLFLTFIFLSGRSYGLTGLVWIFYLNMRIHVYANRVWPDSQGDITRDYMFIIILAFILIMAYQVKRERANRLKVEMLLHELEKSHQQLQDYANKVAEMTIIEERNRLARDIHDSLGHYLTVINVQLEKAIAFRDRSPQTAVQAIRDAKRLSGEALQDIRSSVGALRDIPEPFSLIQALNGLINNLQSRQLNIELNIDGSEEGFSQQSLRTLFRAAQEGLTNIHKHAQAGSAEVSIKFDSQIAILSIFDNGKGFDPSNSDKIKNHYGLLGVKERLELIRGSMELESTPGQGTKLAITVPKTLLALKPGIGGEYERT